MAITFDESTDYYAVTDHASLTLPDADWCFGIWTRVVDNVGPTFQYLLSNGNAGSNDSMNLYVHEDSQATPGIWTLNIVDSSGTNNNQLSSSSPGADSKWRLILCQRDDSVATGNVALYFVEYGQARSSEASASVASFDVVNGGDWNVGRRVDGNPDRYYGSEACEFWKIDAALSQEEMEALGHGLTILELGRLPDIYLPMRADAATLRDLVGGNDGVRNGTPADVEHAPVGQGGWQPYMVYTPVAAGGGRIMSSLAGAGGLAGRGGLAGAGGGLAG